MVVIYFPSVKKCKIFYGMLSVNFLYKEKLAEIFRKLFKQI